MSAKPRTAPRDLVVPVPLARAARRQGPRSAAKRSGNSNPARKYRYIKGLLAVQGVSSEPVSPEFPVKQGKYREFSQIQPRFADSYGLSGWVLWIF